MNNLNLSNKTDLELIETIKSDGCSDCFNEVCKRYENIYFNLCHRYYPIFEKKGLNITDFLEEKNMLIYDCIKSYDPKRKTKLGSHIYNYGRFLILNSFNSKKNLFSATDTEELKERIENTQIKNEYFDSTIKDEDKKFIRDLLNSIKDKRIKKVITLRHFTDKKQRKWKNIAVKMKLSVQSCLILYKKGIKILNIKFKQNEN